MSDEEITYTIKLDPVEPSATVMLCEAHLEWFDGVGQARRVKWEEMLRLRLEGLVGCRSARGRGLLLEEARELASAEVAAWLRDIHAERCAARDPGQVAAEVMIDNTAGEPT